MIKPFRINGELVTQDSIERFYNWERHGGEWVEFEHSVEKTREHEQALRYGSNAFARFVLMLEDLARMVERGINDLQSWIEGVKISTTGDLFTYLLTALGFEKQPTEADVKERNRPAHPDCGESAEQALRGAGLPRFSCLVGNESGFEYHSTPTRIIIIPYRYNL